MGAATAKEAWDTLQEEFQGSKKVRAVKLQSFRRDFKNLKMKDNETSKDYYSRIKELVNQMRAYVENITDKKIVEKILISCTEKYDSVISAIEESKDIETLTPTELMGSLEAHEKRINRRNENTTESAFPSKINMQSQKSKVGGRKIQENFKNKNQDKIFENKSNFPPCEICNKKSHLEKDCWFKPKPQCRNCKKKYGLVEKDCRLKRNHQANFSEEKEGNYLFSCYSLHFEGNSCTIYDKKNKSLIIARVKMQENMLDEPWLWHKRFRHFNFHGLKILWQKNMMRDLPTIKEMDETCEGCMLGKQHRQPFPFGKLCEDEGVQHQLTVGYTLEQNGVSERKNITVMETARAMLMEKGLLKTFWAEAVYTTVYLLNRCLTNSVKDKTPVEAWSGRKSSAKHLRVFSCICYTHIPQEKRSKLDGKTEKGIFLGYSTQSKGYRVYSLRTKKLIISMDVQFDEDMMYNWETEKIERKSINLPALS
ncbi:hypothetical protein UlMin_014553 [Ulmus minor]